MNSNKKLDPNTKEGKKAIGIIVGVFIGILAFAEGLIVLIPFAVLGGIIFVLVKAYKGTQNVDKNGFDYNKSYYESKTSTTSSLSQKIEEEYLKGRNYNQSKVNENNSYFDRKTTEFDKHHAHVNMYPTKIIEQTKKETIIPLTKEDELANYQKELKLLKKDYNEFKIGIIEFREKETVLKAKIKEIKKDILEN